MTTALESILQTSQKRTVTCCAAVELKPAAILRANSKNTRPLGVDRAIARVVGPRVVRTVPTAATATATLREARQPRPKSHETRPTFLSSACSGVAIQLHASLERFESHVEKHLATEEALRAVAFAHPDLIGDIEGDGICNTPRDIVRTLRRDVQDVDAIELTRRYTSLAVRTLDEAHRVGWTVRPNSAVLVAFSPTGFLAVVDGGILRTLFVPGLRDDATRLEEAGYHASELRAQLRREAAWDSAARHYHTAFRPALQVIRSLPIDAVAGDCSQYGALKRVLPGASALRMEGWLAMLQEARDTREEVPLHGE